MFRQVNWTPYFFEDLLALRDTWLLLTILLACLLTAVLLLLIFLRRRICLAIALIEQGSRAVSQVSPQNIALCPGLDIFVIKNIKNLGTFHPPLPPPSLPSSAAGCLLVCDGCSSPRLNRQAGVQSNRAALVKLFSSAKLPPHLFLLLLLLLLLNLSTLQPPALFT